MAKIKKAQDGENLTPTYKNLRMGVANKRKQQGNFPREGYGASKEDSALYRFGFNRGLKGEKEYPGEPPVQKMGRWEGQNAKKPTKVTKPAPKSKMKSGGSLKPVDSSKNPGLAKLPTPVRNKMGYQKYGGKVNKKSK
jgi:hypothetical protein